jgi:hypothetical protein
MLALWSIGFASDSGNGSPALGLDAKSVKLLIYRNPRSN